VSITAPPVAPIPVGDYEFQTTFGQALFDALGPWQTLHLAWYCDAIGAMASPWWEMVTDQGVDDGVTPTVGTYVDGELVTEGYQPGYGEVFNPSVVPLIAADYLAQFVGVALPQGVDDPTAQSLIMAESGINRGTDAAVIAAAKRTLTGTRTVYYYPRTYKDGTPNGFWAGIEVLTSECASLAATEAAVNAVKLGGIMMWFNEITGWTVGAMETAESTITTMESVFRTVGGMEGDTPGA
jgi:hypothetical protein